MVNTLNFLSKGALDFLSLGALVYRLDSGAVPFRKAMHCDIHVSGGEFNVAANLASCFQLNTGIATAMVDYPIGELIAERVRAMGVKPFYKHFKHDGVYGPNMSTVYSDRGYGVRAPVVFYNRANEAAAQLKPGDFQWKEIFGQGVRWFHSGGIFSALSQTTPALIIEAMQAARKGGAAISFDLNYREKLWNAVGGRERAARVFEEILENVDVLIGLDIPGFEIIPETRLDLDGLRRNIDRITRKHPNIKILITTLREVLSTNRHTWSAVAWVDGQIFVSPETEIDVLDRVGSGDGFASGFIYGMLTHESPNEAVKLGWAHGALLATFHGDTTMATVDEVRTLAEGGSARIQR